MGKLEVFLIIAVIILLLFGAKKIPELARSIGQSVREVKKGFSGEGEDTPKTPAQSKTESDDKKA